MIDDILWNGILVATNAQVNRSDLVWVGGREYLGRIVQKKTAKSLHMNDVSIEMDKRTEPYLGKWTILGSNE